LIGTNGPELARLRRHFADLSEITGVGDAHTRARAFVVRGRLPTDTLEKRYFVRLSPSATREHATWQAIASHLEKCASTVRVARHWLLERNILLREYVPGFSLSEVKNYYILSTEAQLLFANSRGLPASVLQELHKVILAETPLFHDFCRQVRTVLYSWPSYLPWRDAVGRHLRVPLAGESLRPLMRMLYAINSSKLKESVGFSLERMRHADAFRATILRLCHETRWAGLSRRLYAQIDEIVQICRIFQLYDIHFDNIILTDTGQLCLIDLECAGIGSSDRLLNPPLMFIEDISDLLDGGDGKSTPWSKKGDFRRQLPAPTPSAAHRHAPGFTRMLLCGSASFENLVRMVREMVFFLVVRERWRDLALDEHDADIASFPQPWRDFQKLKRYVRGVSMAPANVPEAELSALIGWLFDRQPSACSLVANAQAVVDRLRTRTFSRSAPELSIYMRLYELLKFLPIEALLHRAVGKRDLRAALDELLGAKVLGDVASVLDSTVTDIFEFCIPYHIAWVGERYEFGPGLRRRIERKILWTEAMKSAQGDRWLPRLLGE
jgi:hypothetical protein